MVLAVFDGADPESDICGFADVGDERVFYPRTVFANWKQKKTLYVYIAATKIKLADEYPEPSGTFRRRLARLVYQNGTYTVVQEQHGPLIENLHLA